MRRRIAFFSILLALGISCSACGKAETSSSQENISSDAASQDQVAGTDGTVRSDQISHDMRVVVSSFRVESQETAKSEGGEAFPYAYIVYPNITLSVESKPIFPNLAERLESDNAEIEKEALEELSNATGMAVEGEGAWLYTSNYREATATVFRADERMFGYLVNYFGYYNGPHPDMWFKSVAYDSQTGEQLPLADVVTDMKALPQIILEHLEAVDDSYVFDEAENADMLPKIESMVAENDLVWTLDSEGFHVYFDAYDLQFYAFGPIYANIGLEEYPELFAQEYLPVNSGTAGTQSAIEECVSYEDGGTSVYSWEDMQQYYEDYVERQRALWGSEW